MSFLRYSKRLILFTTSVIPTSSIQAPSSRSIKRWVAPTLRELNRRNKKLGTQEPQPRSGFIEWNYRAELFAFSKRLQEDFQMPLLQTAFTLQSYIAKEEIKQRELGITEADIQMTHNSQLAEKGEKITKEYIEAFTRYSFPRVPNEGLKSISSYLMSTDVLANVGLHLGMKELLLDAEYPPSNESMAQSLLAVIGALEESSGIERAFLFVRDFICTQLNQKDFLDIWNMEEPENLLKKICAERKMGELEPRLLGDCGKNTVLAAYHVGIYSNKKLIGKGFGEDIPTATKTASIDALQTLFDLRDNRRPLDFGINVENKSAKLN